jgi:hypothetical protein
MRRFIAYWVVLGTVHFLAGYGTSALAFRNVDLRYQPFLEAILVPAFQAMVLWWVTRRPAPAGWAAALRAAARRPLALAFLAVDLALIAAGLAFRGTKLLSITQDTSLPIVFAAAKALLAGVLFLLLAGRPGFGKGERFRLAAFGACLAALSADAFLPWLGRLPGLLLPHLPRVLQWLIVYGILFGAVVAALLSARAVLEARWPMAAIAVDASTALLLFVGVIAVCNIFFHPHLFDPWRLIVRACLCFAPTPLLLAALAARRDPAGPDPAHGA